MSSFLGAGQKLVNILSQRGVCTGQRKWINLVCNVLTRKYPHPDFLYWVEKNTTKQRFQLCHQHVHSRGLLEAEKPSKKRKKKTSFRKYAPGFIDIEKFFIDFDEKLHHCEKENLTLTDSDWESLLDTEAEKAFLLNYDASVMEKITRSHPPQIAISYMEYVRKKKVPSLRTFTALIGACGEKHPEVVFREYNELLKHYSVIDLNNYKKLIQGFSKTSDWKKCLEFLEEEKQIGGHGDLPPGITYVIDAALTHKDTDTLELLLQTASEYYFLPESFTSAIYNTWCNGHIDVETLLKILSEKKGYLTVAQAEQLDNYLKREMTDRYQSHWATVIDGKCSKSGRLLSGEPVSESHIRLLEERLNNHIKTAKHIYLYSNPQEYQWFSDWLKKKKPFDLIIDAANLYYWWVIPRIQERNGLYQIRVPVNIFGSEMDKDEENWMRKILLETGAKVELIQDGAQKWLLIIGHQSSISQARHIIGEHHVDALQRIEKLVEPYQRVLFICNNNRITKYLKKKFDFRKKFHLYKAEVRSDDDFFMLATALHSGANCYIVSGDNFKNLKSYLGRDVIPMFEHWQRRRQIFIFGHAAPPEMPQQYDFCVQEHKDGWHVPYIPAESLSVWQKTQHKRGYYAMPDTLLCVKRTK